MPTWSPEVVVDEATARLLIGSQFPELGPPRLRLLEVGFDNTVWLANDDLVFRFPRRAMVIPGTQREIAFLPRLAPLLPLAVPRPTYIGAPSDVFPWPFFGAPLIPGRELADAPLSDQARLALAQPLGAFLAALHAPGLLAEVDPHGVLPVDPMGRGDMSRRVPKALEALQEVVRHGLWAVPAVAHAVLDAARDLPQPPANALTHGDLHLRHVLVDHGRPSGVIDWVDLGRANPCVDLVPYWSVIAPSGRGHFLDAYGPVGQDTLISARVLSFNLCALLATYAVSTEKPGLLREAVGGLTRTAAD